MKPTIVQMPSANLLEVARELVATGKQVAVLWQEEESLAFVATDAFALIVERKRRPGEVDRPTA